MSVIDPSEIAVFFVIDDGEKQYDAFIDVNDFDDFSVADVRFRPIGSAAGIFASAARNRH